MSRKKRRRYKLVQPVETEERLPPRVVAVVTTFQWMLWLALTGVLVAFGLILSLYLHWHVSTAVWLRLWPASIQLMTITDASSSHLARLALWATVENGLMYGGVGVVGGAFYAWMRSKRKARQSGI